MPWVWLRSICNCRFLDQHSSVGVPLSQCIGTEKAFNFVSLLNHMRAVAKTNKIRKASLKSLSRRLWEKREVEQGSGGMLAWVS